MVQNSDDLIGKYAVNTVKATQLLYSQTLYAHLLVLIYSSIDSMGLLDAPPSQTSASGESFKNWVKKYLLPNGKFEFNEVDFWAARCSVLHTFTSESDLSKTGKAKEIQYYSGDKESKMAKAFVAATKEIDNGKHVPAHIEDTYLAFLEGLKLFSKDLAANCKSNPTYNDRLNRVLQQFAM